MNTFDRLLIESWANSEGNIYSLSELLEWIERLNNETFVNINECSISDGDFWFYDDYKGEVLNRKRSFFSISGLRRFVDDSFEYEQPVIVQPEIGYLGIICKEIDGVLNFLMQAKIEPGNVNCVQISPTIQATKSNFTRAHGGKFPTYLEYFENSSNYHVIYDQIQSEQASRFLKKRNRNMIMMIEDDIEVLPNFRWMTLGQIKKLMEHDNLVNMDSRTVLSGIPVIGMHFDDDAEKNSVRGIFNDEALFASMFNTNPIEELPSIYGVMNNYKMFNEVSTINVPLNQLVDWHVDENGITCNKQANFVVRYYDIEISGREVQHWTQPLFKALGKATFGLITKVEDGVRKYLIKPYSEIGSFDKIELGPTVYWENTHCEDADDAVDKLFRKKLAECGDLKIDVVLSEEGGRFYHEQNRNVIMEIDADELIDLPEGYIWVSYSTINYLIQVNNCVNIQLRNLMSLINL